jgi:pyruvate/2-oxoglutarate dehydrogenase complex dihydrolipoamide acyltransferase (E2) component
MSDVKLAEEAWEGVEAGTEALLDRWHVGECERVVAGQPLADVVLVKASLEVTAPAAGVIEKILVPKEATFARGQALAVLREG